MTVAVEEANAWPDDAPVLSRASLHGSAWADALRVSAIWVAVGGLTALLAWVTGAFTGTGVSELRLAAPYLSWPLMTPLVARCARRYPLRSGRDVLVHVGLALCLLPLHGLTFRLMMVAFGHDFPGLPGNLGNWTFTVLIELVLYLSTAWPVASEIALRAAYRSDLELARAEAAAAGEELEATLARLGPRQLDELLERVRRAIETSPSTGEEAVTALATYLRAGLAAIEVKPWTLERELEAAAAFLRFEAACGRSLELAVDPPWPHLSTPIRQWTLVEALATLVEEVEGPLCVRLQQRADGFDLRALEPQTERVLAAVEVRG